MKDDECGSFFGMGGNHCERQASLLKRRVVSKTQAKGWLTRKLGCGPTGRAFSVLAYYCWSGNGHNAYRKCRKHHIDVFGFPRREGEKICCTETSTIVCCVGWCARTHQSYIMWWHLCRNFVSQSRWRDLRVVWQQKLLDEVHTWDLIVEVRWAIPMMYFVFHVGIYDEPREVLFVVSIVFPHSAFTPYLIVFQGI